MRNLAPVLDYNVFSFRFLSSVTYHRFYDPLPISRIRALYVRYEKRYFRDRSNFFSDADRLETRTKVTSTLRVKLSLGKEL